jgi:hypothetical protein
MKKAIGIYVFKGCEEGIAIGEERERCPAVDTSKLSSSIESADSSKTSDFAELAFAWLFSLNFSGVGILAKPFGH